MYRHSALAKYFAELTITAHQAVMLSQCYRVGIICIYITCAPRLTVRTYLCASSHCSLSLPSGIKQKDLRFEVLVTAVGAVSTRSGFGRIRTAHLSHANCDSFCQLKRVFNIDAKISGRRFDLGVTEQDLDNAQVFSLLVDQRHLSSNGANAYRSLAVASRSS